MQIVMIALTMLVVVQYRDNTHRSTVVNFTTPEACQKAVEEFRRTLKSQAKSKTAKPFSVVALECTTHKSFGTPQPKQKNLLNPRRNQL